MNKKTVALLLGLLLAALLTFFMLSSQDTQPFWVRDNADTTTTEDLGKVPDSLSDSTEGADTRTNDENSTSSGQSEEAHGSSAAEEPEEKGRVRLYGQVFTEAGAPVKGARVYLIAYPGSTPAPRPEQITAGDGSYAFHGDLLGTYMLYAAKEPMLSFRDQGELKRVVIGKKETNVGPMNLYMKPAENITLLVRDHLSGKPIDGVHIYARGEMNLSYFTKEDGKAGLTLSPGIWSLDLSAPGYGPRSMALDLAGNQPGLIEVGLESAGLVSGIVSNDEGLVLEGMQVICIAGKKEFETKTDMDGYYFFDKVPLDGTFTIHISGAGYQDAWFNWQRFTMSKTSREVNATLRPLPEPDEEEMRTIYGRIIDQEQNPIAGSLAFVGSPGQGGYREFLCDETGLFVAEVPEDRMHSFHIGGYAPGYPASFVYAYEAVDPENPVIIVLTGGHTLAGRVVDHQGAPIAGALLRLQGKGGRLVGDYTLQGMDRIYADGEGRFQLKDLPNQVTIRAWAWGYSGATETLTEDQLDRDDLVLTLHPLSVFSGRVLDENEQPITEFTVMVSGSGVNGDPLSLDAAWQDPGISFWSPDGRFMLRRLEPGANLKLVIQAPGYAAETFVGLTTLPEEEISEADLFMRSKGQRIAGRLRFKSGEPAAGVRLQALAYDAGDPFNAYFSWTGFFRGYYSRNALSANWANTNQSGEFVFEGLPQYANYDLLIAGSGVALQHVDDVEDLDDTQIENMDVTVYRGAILEGSVNRDHYSYARKLELISVRSEDFSIPIELEDDTENFTVSQLPAGRYRLKLIGWERPENRETLSEIIIDLQAGERRSLILDSTN